MVYRHLPGLSSKRPNFEPRVELDLFLSGWGVSDYQGSPMQEYTTEEIDRRFALLKQYERRCLVDFLQQTEAGHAPLDDVVSHLQKQEQTPDDRKKIATALRHRHLPRLNSTDMLEFDWRSGTVRYHGDELVEALLESTPETHNPMA